MDKSWLASIVTALLGSVGGYFMGRFKKHDASAEDTIRAAAEINAFTERLERVHDRMDEFVKDNREIWKSLNGAREDIQRIKGQLNGKQWKKEW